jgi:hypothetical protein
MRAIARRRYQVRRTPANLVAISLITSILVAWLVVLLHGPSGHSQHAEALGTDGSAIEGHIHGGPAGSVADRIVAEAPAVGFCISASLEPFVGSIEQIRQAGPNEATERFRRCLLDTMFDHADVNILDDLELHRPHFLACFGALAGNADTQKSEVVQSTLKCVEQTAI